jgi:hypothetical protein
VPLADALRVAHGVTLRRRSTAGVEQVHLLMAARLRLVPKASSFTSAAYGLWARGHKNATRACLLQLRKFTPSAPIHWRGRRAERQRHHRDTDPAGWLGGNSVEDKNAPAGLEVDNAYSTRMQVAPSRALRSRPLDVQPACVSLMALGSPFMPMGGRRFHCQVDLGHGFGRSFCEPTGSRATARAQYSMRGADAQARAPQTCNMPRMPLEVAASPLRGMQRIHMIDTRAIASMQYGATASCGHRASTAFGATSLEYAV